MKRKAGTVRVVFADGETNDVDASECRVWSKPDETAWRKSRAASSRHVEAANRQSAHCAVEQLDVATEEKLARWPSAKKVVPRSSLWHLRKRVTAVAPAPPTRALR